MTTQPNPIDPVQPLAISADALYAPRIIEQTFDVIEGEQAHGPQNHAGFTPHLLTALSDGGAGSPASREDMLAVKTAQYVAADLADNIHAAIAASDTKFDHHSHVRHIARSVAAAMAPVLQPLPRDRRKHVAAMAVDPSDPHRALDLVLDGVGQVLDVYCDFLPSPMWAPLAAGPMPDGTADARVLGWRIPSGEIALDLVDTVGPERSNAEHRHEVHDILRVATERFGCHFATLRYLPAYAIAQARFYWPEGDWDPYYPRPTLRLIT